MQKNNLKKLLKPAAALLAASVLLAATGFAAAPTAVIDGSTITVNLEIEEAGYGVMVYALNAKVADTDTIDQAFLRDHLVCVTSYDGGELALTLPSDAPYGAYTVIVGSVGLSDIKSARLAYVLNKEPGIDAAAVLALKGASSATAMADKFSEYNDRAFIVDMDDVNDNKEMIYELVCKLGASATADDYAACVTRAIEFNAMKTYTAEQISRILTDNYASLGLDEDILLYSDEVAELVKADIAGCQALSDIQALVEESLALTALNNAAPTAFFEVLEKYNGVFNVTLSSNLSAVSDYEIRKILAGIKFTDVSTVGNQINTEIDKLWRNNNNSGGLSGGIGGFGGGGGGGYSSTSTLTKPTVDDLNDNQIAENKLSDLEGYDWATDAINALFAKGIISGDGNGNFRPGDPVTREEFTKILVAAFNNGKITESELKFTDVKDEWYKPYIETAFSLGIVNGLSEEIFGVGEYLTRQDAAVMVKRAADATYKDIKKKQTLVSFTDSDDISDYARVSVDVLARAQIFNGFEDGSFRPLNNITRAEIAKVIYGCTEQ